MMSEIEESSPSQPNAPTRVHVIAAMGAIVAAGAPHAFFLPPTLLHHLGQMQAWLGIAVWAPAILAGVAFFFGAEFSSRDDTLDGSITPEARAMVVLGLMLVALMLTAHLCGPWWTYQFVSPWEELRLALPMFAALGALRAVFWQGWVQQFLLRGRTKVARLALPIVGELAVVAPFFVPAQEASRVDYLHVLVPIALAEAVVGAVSHHVGCRVRTTMLARATLAAGAVWFQQSLFA